MILKRYYQFILKYKGMFAAFMTVGIVSFALESTIPYFLKLLIDGLDDLNYEYLVRILALYVGIRIAGNLLGVLSFYLGDKVLIPSSRDARLRVFRYIQDLDFAYHVNKNTGSLISAFKRGDGSFFSLFHRLHFEILGAVVNLAVALFFFSQISSDILVVMVALFVVNIAISWFLIKINLKRRQEFNESEDEISGIITDNLINYETVKFFAQENREEKRLRKTFETWTAKMWGFSNSFRIMDVTIGTLSAGGMFLVLWITLRNLVAGRIGVGDFVMVSGFMTGFYFRFFQLLYQFRHLAKDFIDLDKYFSILNEEVVVKEPKQPFEYEGEIKGEITIKDLSFSYPGKKDGVLRDINLKIEPGESVAFVGKSGAGKSTLIRLLLRFYDLRKGKILIDGKDITKLNKSYLRSFIGVVPQEPVLFNNTIGFNIGYGREDVDQDEIQQAAKLANLHDFIKELKDGYETQVGERGIKLSGGQKQRLAIARALLIDPKIMVFDEATSNLDSESEEAVQDALWSTAKNRTMLIIAHRFSTIRKADKIVVLDKGRVAEIGTHKQLLEKEDGVYRKLWHLQAKGKLEKDEGGLIPVGEGREE